MALTPAKTDPNFKDEKARRDATLNRRKSGEPGTDTDYKDSPDPTRHPQESSGGKGGGSK